MLNIGNCRIASDIQLAIDDLNLSLKFILHVVNCDYFDESGLWYKENGVLHEAQL